VDVEAFLAIVNVTLGIRVARQIEPMPRVSLAITRRGKEAVDQVFVSIRD